MMYGNMTIVDFILLHQHRYLEEFFFSLPTASKKRSCGGILIRHYRWSL